MREIKFRAWDIDNKKMLNVIMDEGYLGAGKDEIGIADVFEWNEKYIPLQFTGLKDKNGVEIYEEDIVSLEWNQRLFVVHWGEYQFGTNCVIVGNIYENPELMNDKP